MNKYDFDNLTYTDLPGNPMTREEYQKALSNFSHPRHKEAMEIRSKKVKQNFFKPSERALFEDDYQKVIAPAN